ncbi:MAG: AEC family transporter [Geminicoccaceae bacterium]
MDSIATSVVPLFSVIFIGFAFGKLGGIDQDGIRTLVAFVFSLAMPALIFRLMANTDFAAIDDWPVVFAYFTAQLPIFLGGLIIGGWLFRQPMAEMTIQAFGSSFSNGVVLGLPLVLSLFGERAAVPALLIIMLDILIFSATTLLLEIASLRERSHTAPRPLYMMRDLALSVGANPLILASLLGIGFGLSGLAMPEAVDGTLAFVGQAAPPAGLFALGATLSQKRDAGRIKPVMAMMVMKLALHPLLAWGIVFFLFELDHVAASVALLFAACPVGANVYVFAAQYRIAEATSATAILFSTAIALFTLSGIVLLLPMS